MRGAWVAACWIAAFSLPALGYQAAQDLESLASLMGNSSKDLADAEAYVVTLVKPAARGALPALEIVEEYRDGNTDDLTMLEKRTLPLAAIHSVALQRVGPGAESARNHYLIITYRTGSNGSKVYQYRSEDDPAFGALKSFRLGVYTRSRAEIIRARLAPRKETAADPPPP